MCVCRGQLHLHPEWVQLVTADKQLLYWNRMKYHFGSAFVPAEVGGTCGGFLCDEMVRHCCEFVLGFPP